MKPILPKGTGVSPIQGIFSSPRTTIILAPAAASLGTPLSSPLILPAPPTSTITLAAHRVPQPTPVILPLTKTTASSSNVQLQYPLLAANSPPRLELKDQQAAITCLSGKSLKRNLCKKNKERRDSKQYQSKYSNSETPILPKQSQSDPQTVILLHSASGKAVTITPPVVVPKCSLVVSDDMHSHTTLKEKKKTKENDNKDFNKKLSKLKNINQENFPQSKKLKKSSGNCTKAVGLKFSKKTCVDNHNITEEDEGSKIKPADVHQDDAKKGSSLAIQSGSSMYSPESFILSAEGYLNQSDNFSHQQDVPHHPPPPYPQDSVVEISSSAESTEVKQDPCKSHKYASEPATSGSKFFHVKRKKCEWKHKRHSVAERLSIASSSIPVPEMRSDFSSKVIDVSDNHMSPSPSLLTRCAQPCITPSSSNLSVDITAGKTCVTGTLTVASSCFSSTSHSYSPLSKNRNMSPSVCKSNTDHKGPPYEPHTPLPASSPSLDDGQVLLLTPGKSSQSKSFEQPYPLPVSSIGVCIAGVPSGSSHSSRLASTQSVSHTSYCSQTSIVTHLSQSPTSSLSYEINTNTPSCGGAVSYESKPGGTAVPSQTGHQFTLNTQRAPSSISPHLDVCDQAPSSAFYFQPPQCNTSLHSVLHSHSCTPCTETNSVNPTSFPSYMPSQDQTFIHKVVSHSPLHSDSSQASSYTQTPQLTPYMDPPHLNPYSQSSQPKLTAKSLHPPYLSSHQLPSYTQSSRSLSHTQSTQVALNTTPDHSTSHARPSPSVAHGHSQVSYIEGSHSNSCLNTEHTSYLQPIQPIPLCGDSHHGKTVSDHHSPQEVSFSSEYAPSYPSPQGGSYSQPSHTPVSMGNLSALFKDNSQSPVLPLYAANHDASSTQCYSNYSNIPYTSQQTNAHDPHYYSIGRYKALTPSSVDASSPHFTLEKSLNPPPYEAHIQNAASYIASETHEQATEDNSQHSHHQTSPANYSLSCQIVRDQESLSQSLHEDSKKIVNSSCAAPSPLLSLTSSPRYTYNQQLTHEDPQIDHSIIADIARGTYDYDVEESSQTYFPPTTPDAHLALPSENQPPNPVEYSSSHSLNGSHSTSIHISSHCVQNSNAPLRLQTSQSRVLVYPLARQESLYKNSDQDGLGVSSWSSTTRSTGHSDNMRIEKLLFIPHSEQTCLVVKKESSKTLSSNSGLHITKELMLKKFWIEEDEPIAEEIVSSLPSKLTSPQTSPSKQNKPRQMLCQICGKMLRGRNSLRCHLNSHHNIQPHSCSTCGKSFTNRSVLVEHLRIHSGETPYLCSICDTAFRTRSGLLRHGSMHTSARPHECSMCSKKFKTKLVLQQHMKLHLTDVFTCSECGKTFERRKSLAVHKAFHHHKTQRFKCPHCPKGYHFRSLLNHHMQLHSSVHKHICSTCGKSFVWRSGLAAHMKTHSTSRPKCDICDMQFASEKRLQSHYKHHRNPKPHQCKVCGRNFSHAYRLVSHSLIHQDHKEYVCHKCDIVFTNAKKFRKHLVTHKKEEPRICRLSGTIQVSNPML